MARQSNQDLNNLAAQHNLTVVRDGKMIAVKAGDELLYSASVGEKVTGAIEAIQQYTQTLEPNTPGSEYPVTRRVSYYSDESNNITSIDRNYDQERPLEYPVRDTKRARQLQEMYCDGGILEAAINEIVDSAVASSDGDDRGFVVSDKIGKTGQKVKPEVLFILGSLQEIALDSATLNAIAQKIIWFGDCFGSIGLQSNPNNLWSIRALDFLPTFEMFRVEQYLEGIKHTHFEQRRYLSDEEYIVIPDPLLIHWRFRYRGGLYGTPLFGGEACYRAWDSLRNAESDLRAATRNVGVKPLAHIFPENTADAKLEAYQKKIKEKRKRDGIITDYYMVGGRVEGVSNLDGDVSGLTSAIEYWRKNLATHSRVPGYLLGVKSDGARDIAQQPALAYSRLINSLRQDITVGLRKLCNTELQLHGLNPSDPNNAYEILWPKIVVNAYEAPVSERADESAALPDTEADCYLRAKDARARILASRMYRDRVLSHQAKYWGNYGR